MTRAIPPLNAKPAERAASDSRTVLTIGDEKFVVVRRTPIPAEEEQCPLLHPLFLVETYTGAAFVVCDACSSSRIVPRL